LRIKGIIATTHVDLQREKLALSALEGLVAQTNDRWIPLGMHHDPRIPPIGRVLRAELKQLDDGEWGVETESEIFEPGEAPAVDPSRKYRPNLRPNGDVGVVFDFAYRNAEDAADIAALSKLLNSKSKPRYEAKKAAEPITILTIAGGFVLGNITGGFFGQIGADAYEAAKEKLQSLLDRKRRVGSDTLLVYDWDVTKDGDVLKVKIVLTNPSASDIDWAFREGMHRLDEYLIEHFDALRSQGARELLVDFEHEKINLKFAINEDCLPLFPNDDETAKEMAPSEAK